jgi:hypothetical protein
MDDGDLEVTFDHIPTDLGWGLASWLLDAGADEFTFRCVAARSSNLAVCRAADLALSAYRVRTREDSFQTATVPGTDRRWRLTRDSLEVLRGLLPDGILTDRQGSDDGWIEDLTVYRGDVPCLEVNTHEHRATLRLTDAEYGQLREARLID